MKLTYPFLIGAAPPELFQTAVANWSDPYGVINNAYFSVIIQYSDAGPSLPTSIRIYGSDGHEAGGVQQCSNYWNSYNSCNGDNADGLEIHYAAQVCPSLP